MGIGKRKGKVVKGAGNPGSSGSDNVGGSLSKNDHWYINQAFGMVVDPGTVAPSNIQLASGGVIKEYPSGQEQLQSSAAYIPIIPKVPLSTY